MKYLLSLVALLLLPLAASAQTAPPLACPSGTYQEGNVCIRPAPQPPVVVQEQPPVVVQQAPPQCPFGTYYQAGVCVQPAPVYIPPVYNPWENVPFNQIPGWPGGHPGVTQVPGGWIGPGGHFHPR